MRLPKTIPINLVQCHNSVLSEAVSSLLVTSISGSKFMLIQVLAQPFINYVTEKLVFSFIKWNNSPIIRIKGFPDGKSGKEPACQSRRYKRRRFNLWVGKISWKRAWQLTPISLPGEFLGQRSLVGYSP